MPSFPCPSDPAAHALASSVRIVATSMTQSATALLLPQHKPELTYNTNYMSGLGSLS